MNHSSRKAKRCGLKTSTPDYRFECAKRGLDHVPLIQTYLEQLEVNPLDSLCHAELHREFSRFDAEQVLNPQPFGRSNPDGFSVHGQIRLGKVRHTDAVWGIDPDSLTTHAIFAGRTGGGKSTMIFHILRQLMEMS